MIKATKKWLFLKISSLIMVPLMLWFLVNFVLLYDSSYNEILAFLSSQPSKLLFSLFLVSMFFYSALSISEVFEDYIHVESTKKLLNIGVFLSSLIIPSVSYTHLRAHETERNRVCRLLLEKNFF